VLQPLVVRALPGGTYELIAGERRLRASKIAKLEAVPAIVRDAEGSERLELALLENVAREDLNPVDEARACAILVDDLGVSKAELASRIGKSRPAVANAIRLLDLPDDVLGMLERGQLTEGHARAVLAVPDHEGRRRLAREIVQKGLSVRAAEQRAKWAGAKQKPRVRAASVDPALAARVRDAFERLTGFHAKVGSGRVELPFADEHELAELAEALELAASRL
jgi:ParB family transcriptional regulator, chromosome partitioning protein